MQSHLHAKKRDVPFHSGQEENFFYIEGLINHITKNSILYLTQIIKKGIKLNLLMFLGKGKEQALKKQ